MNPQRILLHFFSLSIYYSCYIYTSILFVVPFTFQTVLADDTERFVKWPYGIITDYLEVIVVRENLIKDLIISEVTLIGCVEGMSIL